MRILLRDDDFGWEEAAFSRLHALCKKHHYLLSAAAIPQACVDPQLWNWDGSPYLELTGHGSSHRNHQREGKKSEFSSDRDIVLAVAELVEGIQFLATRYGKIFFPVFVPPWNRVSEDILSQLAKVGYFAVSRFGENVFQESFPEFNVQVDLHTRKIGSYESVADIWQDIQAAWDTQDEDSPRFVGLMLHHNKMSDSDFSQLEQLFRLFAEKEVKIVSYREQFAAWKNWHEK